MKIDINNAELKEFNDLDKCASRKQKYIRANNSICISKALWKEIMRRSRLRNKFLRERERERARAREREREREKAKKACQGHDTPVKLI